MTKLLKSNEYVANRLVNVPKLTIAVRITCIRAERHQYRGLYSNCDIRCAVIRAVSYIPVFKVRWHMVVVLPMCGVVCTILESIS